MYYDLFDEQYRNINSEQFDLAWSFLELYLVTMCTNACELLQDVTPHFLASSTISCERNITEV